MARNPVLDAYGGFLKTNFPGSRVTEIGLNGDDDDEKKERKEKLEAMYWGLPPAQQDAFAQSSLGYVPVREDKAKLLGDTIESMANQPIKFGGQGFSMVAPPSATHGQTFEGTPEEAKAALDALESKESQSDVSIPAKPGAIAAPEGPSQLDLEYMTRGLLVPGDPTRRLDANQARGRIMDLGIDVDEPDFEAQTRAVAPRSFFDKIRGGISKIGEGLQREGVSEALGQFSRDIIATPDIGTALGPALGSAARELELGEERIAGLEEQKRIEEMNQAELVMHHLQRGDSQSAMQAMKFIEMMTEVPPEQDWQIYTSNPVMKDGVSGFLAVDKKSGEVKFFTAEAVNASGAKADKDAILGIPALEANEDLTVHNRDFAMAGVPVARNEAGELYATSEKGGVAAVLDKDLHKAMMGQFISQAVSGDENFFVKTIKDFGRAFTRTDPIAQEIQQGYVDAYNFINPIVRYLSGAQMTDAEARRYYIALIPKPGDPFNIVINKRKKRELLALAMQGDESVFRDLTPELFKKRGDRTGRFSSENDPTGARAANQILGELDELYGSTGDVGSEMTVEDEELPL